MSFDDTPYYSGSVCIGFAEGLVAYGHCNGNFVLVRWWFQQSLGSVFLIRKTRMSHLLVAARCLSCTKRGRECSCVMGNGVGDRAGALSIGRRGFGSGGGELITRL